MSAEIIKDFTLSNARRFYPSIGNPLAGKGRTKFELYISNTLVKSLLEQKKKMSSLFLYGFSKNEMQVRYDS